MPSLIAYIQRLRRRRRMRKRRFVVGIGPPVVKLQRPSGREGPRREENR
jgi:hypothetical protein